ncbi:hypothetical protein [Sinorhizobium chiapasense]|uniref:Uncharacterized protein n=1 Tax=Sinorhizobium chiapasense TaxID=501572 RepID=A0ABZ2BII0_9HYPH
MIDLLTELTKRSGETVIPHGESLRNRASIGSRAIDLETMALEWACGPEATIDLPNSIKQPTVTSS